MTEQYYSRVNDQALKVAVLDRPGLFLSPGMPRCNGSIDPVKGARLNPLTNLIFESPQNINLKY